MEHIELIFWFVAGFLCGAGAVAKIALRKLNQIGKKIKE